MFDAGGVDLCLVGHNHFYERTDPIHGGQVVDPGQGTVYITSGNGGAGLYTMLPAADFVAAWTDQVYGFTQVTVEGTHIEIMHVDSEGNVVDQVSWDKSP